MADVIKIDGDRLHFLWDYVHGLEAVLEEIGGPAGNFSTASAAACYEYDGITIPQFTTLIDGEHRLHDEALTLYEICLCDKPIKYEFFGEEYSPNSGSHRGLITVGLNDGGEEQLFVLAIEELETFSGGYWGDKFIIGALTNCGKELAIAGGEEFAYKLFSGAIEAATGITPVITTTILSSSSDLRSDKSVTRSRSTVVVTDAASLVEQECQLSAEAEGSFPFLTRGFVNSLLAGVGVVFGSLYRR